MLISTLNYTSAAVFTKIHNTYPKNLHILVHLGLQEANLLVALCVPEEVNG